MLSKSEWSALNHTYSDKHYEEYVSDYSKYSMTVDNLHDDKAIVMFHSEEFGYLLDICKRYNMNDFVTASLSDEIVSQYIRLHMFASDDLDAVCVFETFDDLINHLKSILSRKDFKYVNGVKTEYSWKGNALTVTSVDECYRSVLDVKHTISDDRIEVFLSGIKFILNRLTYTYEMLKRCKRSYGLYFQMLMTAPFLGFVSSSSRVLSSDNFFKQNNELPETLMLNAHKALDGHLWCKCSTVNVYPMLVSNGLFPSLKFYIPSKKILIDRSSDFLTLMKYGVNCNELDLEFEDYVEWENIDMLNSFHAQISDEYLAVLNETESKLLQQLIDHNLIK